jgi:hypothetical protein
MDIIIYIENCLHINFKNGIYIADIKQSNEFSADPIYFHLLK